MISTMYLHKKKLIKSRMYKMADDDVTRKRLNVSLLQYEKYNYMFKML